MYPNSNSRIIQVNYDLISPGQKYSKIAEYLQGYGTWAKALQSLWFVKTTSSVDQVRDGLLRIVDSNDKVLCVDTTGSNWASYGLPVEITDWLRLNSPVGAYR